MKLTFTGDVCFNYQNIDKEQSKKVLSEIKPYLASDLLVMNFETPVAPEGIGAPIKKSGPPLISKPECVEFLKEAGCKLAVLANNHTGDYGPDALNFTLDTLDAHGIAHIGAGQNIDEAYSAFRFEKDGISVSIISVCENEFGIAERDKAGAAGYDPELIADKISEEKQISDRVIVVFHGGCERNPLPSPGARARYRSLIRFGADAVIAGHPHCIEGYEYFMDCPIVYSTGNFMFPHTPVCGESWYFGYIAELCVGDRITVCPIPYRVEKDGSVIHPLTGGELEKMLAYIEKLSLIIPDTDELKRLYEGWCHISGLQYVKSLVAKPEYFEKPDVSADNQHLKNLLSCEAHRELMRGTLDLAFFGKLGEAALIAEEIKELQKMPID